MDRHVLRRLLPFISIVNTMTMLTFLMQNLLDDVLLAFCRLLRKSYLNFL